MSLTAHSTITSKGQITLPASWRRKLGLEPGLRVSLRQVDGGIVVEAPPDLTTWRERARAEMAAAGTWGTPLEAAPGWAEAAVQKLELADG